MNQDWRHCQTPDLQMPQSWTSSSRTVGNEFLVFLCHPDYGVLLKQPE